MELTLVWSRSFRTGKGENGKKKKKGERRDTGAAPCVSSGGIGLREGGRGERKRGKRESSAFADHTKPGKGRKERRGGGPICKTCMSWR